MRSSLSLVIVAFLGAWADQPESAPLTVTLDATGLIGKDRTAVALHGPKLPLRRNRTPCCRGTFSVVRAIDTVKNNKAFRRGPAGPKTRLRPCCRKVEVYSGMDHADAPAFGLPQDWAHRGALQTRPISLKVKSAPTPFSVVERP